MKNDLKELELSFSSIEVDEKEIVNFSNEVKELLKDDIIALNTIRKLEKTDKTFNNSIGNVYQYIIDRENCSNCKKLSECKKNTKKIGYFISPYYDKDRDEIRLSTQECKYQKEKNQILDNIFTSILDKDKIYEKFNSLIEFLRKDNNLSLMKDTSKILFSIMKEIKDFKKDKNYIGYSFSSINNGKLIDDLLSSIAFMYARYNYSVSYFDTYDFFVRFLDKEYEIQDDIMKAFNKVNSSDVVIFKNFDLFPKFGLETLSNHLYEFLLARENENKVTYFSTTGISLDKVVYYRTKNTNINNECKTIINKIAKNYVIKDMDIR